MVLSVLHNTNAALACSVAGEYLFCQAESRQSVADDVGTTCRSLQFAVQPAKGNERKMGTEHKQIRKLRQICPRK